MGPSANKERTRTGAGNAMEYNVQKRGATGMRAGVNIGTVNVYIGGGTQPDQHTPAWLPLHATTYCSWQAQRLFMFQEATA